MKVYEAFVKAIQNLGVTTAFGGAGENAAGLMLALERSKVRGIITKNEQAAAFMACGYAMYTNRLGVCFATAGPGAFNLISGLSMALTDSYPVLGISGYSSIEFEGKGSLNETSGKNRTPDSRAMFAATTKANFLLDDIANTCDVLEEAVNIAFEGRPGPVHIEVAEDLTARGMKVANYHDIDLQIKPVEPDLASVKKASALLTTALKQNKQVVALVGFGAIRSRAGEVLQALFERYQIPVLTTLDGKGIVPEEHPLAVGVFSDSGHKSAWDTFLKADVVLAIGNSFAQHDTFDFKEDLFEGKQLLHINIDPVEIDKVYKTDAHIVADASLAASALADDMAASLDAQAPRAFATQDYDAEAIVGRPFKVHPGKMAQRLSQMLPDNAIVLGDAGAHVTWLGYYLELRKGQNFRHPGTYGPMAGHTNGAIGAKCAEPERTVVVGCGDGCYLMSGFELMTAVQYDIPVIWIIFNDGEFKLIKLYQLAAYQRDGLVNFHNPDYAAYAKACGAEGYTVTSTGEFEDALAAAIASGKPTLIDAKISRLAIPNYSTGPEGLMAGLWDGMRKRVGGSE